MVFLGAGCGGAGGSAPTDSTADQETAMAGQALVGVAPGKFGDPAVVAAIGQVGTILSSDAATGFYQVQLNSGMTLASASAALTSSDIVYVEPNWEAHTLAAAPAPNDTYWAQQYPAAVQTEVQEAWKLWSPGGPVDPASTASGTITIDVTTLQPGDTVSVGSYTFIASSDPNAQASQKMFAIATGSTPNEDTAAGLVEDMSFNFLVTSSNLSASNVGAVVTVTDTTPGSAGNNVAFATSNSTAFTFSGPTLSGGQDSTTFALVAVVDTGVDVTHDDLKNKVVTGYNALDTSSIVTDSDGHGTQVAGVVAAEINNGAGVAGIAAVGNSNNLVADDLHVVKIMPIKVSSSTLPPTHASIASGVSYAVDHGANVVLISLGSGAPSWTLQSAIQYAYAHHVLVVAAAGNSGSSVMKYPAAYQAASQKVLSVTSVGATDTLSSDANYGSWVNLAAPGENIITTTLNDGYTNSSMVRGSSYSAAFVAGAAALVWSAYPPATTHTAGALTLDELRNLLITSVDGVSQTAGKTLPAAAGRLNVQAAMLNAVNASSATPVVVPSSLFFNASSVASGGTLTGTVVLSGPVTGSALAVSLSSTGTDSAAATVPASVSIPVGSSSGTFSLKAGVVTADKAPVITATAHSATVSRTVTVSPPGLVSIKVDKSSVTGGTTLTGTLTFNVAPATATNVTVTSSNTSAIANVGTVTVAAKSVTATFSIPTQAVAADQNSITLTATQGSNTATAQVAVLAPVVLSLKFNLSSTVVWQSPGTSGAVTGTVTLSGNSKGGTAVQLWPSDLGIRLLQNGNPVQLSSGALTVTVPDGSSTTTFTVQPEPATVATTYSVIANTGTYNASTNAGKSASFKVTPALASLALSATSVMGAGSATGTVTLSAVAPTGGIAVALTSSQSRVTVNGSVTVPAGALTVTFPITVAAGTTVVTSTIDANLLGVDVTKTITAAAPVVSKLALSPSSIAVNDVATATVTLSSAAPASYTVQLVSATPAKATVPASVTATAGATTVTFQVTGVAAGSSVITVTDPTGNAKTATVTVTAPSFSVSFSGATPVGGLQNVTGTITLAKAVTSATTVSLSGNGKVTVPASITISSGKTGTFAVTTLPAAADTGSSVTATIGTESQSANLTVKQTLALAIATQPTDGGGAAGSLTVTLAATPASAVNVVLALSGTSASSFVLSGSGVSGSGPYTVSVSNTTPVSVTITEASGSAGDVATVTPSIGSTAAGAAATITSL